jgi:DNA polymerase
VLDEALDDLGIAHDEVYVTNAVKHFKWTQQGKRRLHAKPSAREMNACHPWLEAEIEAIAPRVIVCLGATAAQSMLGSKFRITRERGKLIDSDGRPAVLATYHPSAILRAPEKSDRDRMRAEFADDLRVALKASRSRSKSRHAAR